MRDVASLRAAEDGYTYLDEGGHVYLDWTGAGLPARAQLRAHARRITRGCFGNPHSVSPASAASGELVERARRLPRLRHTVYRDRLPDPVGLEPRMVC